MDLLVIFITYVYILEKIKNSTCLIKISETEGYLMSEFAISNTNSSKLLGAITDKTHKLGIVVVNGTGERDKFTEGSKLRITGERYIAGNKTF